jgi:hypothetical protein
MATPAKPNIPQRPSMALVNGIDADSSDDAKAKPTIPQRPQSMAPGTLPPRPKPSIPQRPAVPSKPIEKKAQEFTLGDGPGSTSSVSNTDVSTDEVSEKEDRMATHTHRERESCL